MRQAQTLLTEKVQNSVSCASSCRINQEVNGSFQKYTLLIIKKLAIDLLFLLEVNTITEIYTWSVGITPLKATWNSDQGSPTSRNPDKGVHWSLETWAFVLLA